MSLCLDAATAVADFRYETANYLRRLHCMQPRLLARESGDLHPRLFAQTVTADLLRSLAPAPQHRFNGDVTVLDGVEAGRPHNLRAHDAGTSSLALDKFDGRLLLSGGADGSIKLWDLEDCATQHQTHTFRPRSTIARSTRGPRSGGHSHGITHLAFYPFDPDAFLSSSFDKTLKLWATERAALTAEFDLNATIYSHATSPVAQHLMVACATQHSNVRLVHLKSGSAVQALVAHGGPVLSAAWSPRHEHVLVSGHADGRARIWDVRRAGGVIAQLDQDDAVGMGRQTSNSCTMTYSSTARAHDEAVNGLQWTDDGRFIVSAGLDGRIRVWDADRGANTLASFGATVRNQHARTASFVVPPSGLSAGRQLLVWPNDHEIVVLDMHEGSVVTRLRCPPGSANHPLGSRGNRITNIAWRGTGGGIGQTGPIMGGGNSVGAIYSAHMDGQIRAWMPRVPGPDDGGENEDEGMEDAEVRRRKRKVVDDAYRSLMGRQITFT